MALSELVAAIQHQIVRQREKEYELLAGIESLSDYETAEAAADIYDPEKHAYSFDHYLYKLSELHAVLLAGVPADAAIEAVDSFADADTVIRNYARNQDMQKMHKEMKEAGTSGKRTRIDAGTV